MSMTVTADAALAHAEAALKAVSGVVLEPGDVAGARELARTVERLSRRVRALQIDVVSAIEAGGLHQPDGHGSARVMVEHVNHLSPPEAKRPRPGASDAGGMRRCGPVWWRGGSGRARSTASPWCS